MRRSTIGLAVFFLGCLTLLGVGKMVQADVVRNTVSTCILEMEKEGFRNFLKWRNPGIYLTEDKLTLAVMTDQERNLIRIDENKARIFIRFPLVGTEQFPFPVIVNAQELHPNEPRSGITLVDGERSDEAQDNKRSKT